MTTFDQVYTYIFSLLLKHRTFTCVKEYPSIVILLLLLKYLGTSSTTENYTVPQPKKKVAVQIQEEEKTDMSLLECNMTAPPAVQESDRNKSWTKRVIQEICAFLILSNIMVMSWIVIK